MENSIERGFKKKSESISQMEEYLFWSLSMLKVREKEYREVKDIKTENFPEIIKKSYEDTAHLVDIMERSLFEYLFDNPREACGYNLEIQERIASKLGEDEINNIDLADISEKSTDLELIRDINIYRIISEVESERNS